MIIFKEITKDNYKECFALSVNNNQTNFVDSTTLSLAKAFVFKDISKPFAIYNDNIMIGFLLLRFDYEINNCFLWEFLIDKKYQSNGLGKQSLLYLIDWVKNSTKFKSISTTYKYGNETAKNLYYSLGFKYLSNCIEHNEEDLILYINR